MSMNGGFLPVTREQLDRLLADPESVPTVLSPDDGSEPPGLLLVDKAWHALHFLLTGSDWEGEPPWSLVVLGGEPIGPDLGYGPARYLLPDEVREVAQALSGLPRDELAKRYSPRAMDDASIYPQFWQRDPEGLEYVLSFYEELVKHYREAAARSDAMLLFLS